MVKTLRKRLKDLKCRLGYHAYQLISGTRRFHSKWTDTVDGKCTNCGHEATLLI